MSSVEDRLSKLREERLAREKARIEKLRELNLKKYNKSDPPTPHSHSLVKSSSVTSIKNAPMPVKNHAHVYRRPTTAPILARANSVAGFANSTAKSTAGATSGNATAKSAIKLPAVVFPRKSIAPTAKSATTVSNLGNTSTALSNSIKTMVNVSNVKKIGKVNDIIIKDNKTSLLRLKKDTKDASKGQLNSNGHKHMSTIVEENGKTDNKVKFDVSNGPNHVSKVKANVSSVKFDVSKVKTDNKGDQKTDEIDQRILKEIKIVKDFKSSNLSKLAMKNSMRKSMFVAPTKSFEKPSLARKSLIPKTDTKCESVFERLYKPKIDVKKPVTDVEKLQDPSYLKKVIRNSVLITNKNPPKAVRRSISAVHFKRISRSEIDNCIHKWSSIGDKLDKAHLKPSTDVIEEETVTSAVKSEVKRIKFMTPMSNMMTPRPEELQARLKNWLKKRGKSLDSYHHLQCFGIHHLSKEPPPQFDLYDEENKENIAKDSDSDDGSYTENMNDVTTDPHTDSHKIDIEQWRRVSSVSESVDFNESCNFNESTITSADTVANSEDLVTGALNDLADMLREGFDWEQSARWLRAIRSRFPYISDTAAYWECRAALEEGRGDLPASVQCWEEAIAKGTERSVVEANLDQLLDKFMQLKLSPASGNKPPNPKMVDVKNVFKSTIIRFAVQQAKLRESQTPIVTVTPVRRSGRLSHRPAPRTCESLRHASQLAPLHRFTPNKNLVTSP